MKPYLFCFFFLFSSLFSAENYCTKKHILEMQKEIESLFLLLPQEQLHVMGCFVNTLRSQILPEITNNFQGTISDESQKILLLEWADELFRISNEQTPTITKFVGRACNLLGLLQYHIQEQELAVGVKNVQKPIAEVLTEKREVAQHQ